MVPGEKFPCLRCDDYRIIKTRIVDPEFAERPNEESAFQLYIHPLDPLGRFTAENPVFKHLEGPLYTCTVK